MKAIFTPNHPLFGTRYGLVSAGWTLVVLLGWQLFTPAFLPRPAEVADAWLGLLTSGALVTNLLSSLVLNAEAILGAALVSLGFAYLSVIPVFRPLIHAFTLSRFLGFVGFSFILGVLLSGHELKLSMVVIAIATFYVTGMVSVIEEIPDKAFDYARTLRMSNARLTWEVIVQSTRPAIWSVIRQNGAIGWIMMVQAENYVRSEGGLGTALIDQQRLLALAPMIALQGTILAVALLQDFLFGQLDGLLHPWTAVKRQER